MCELYARPLLEVSLAERVQDEVKGELLELAKLFESEPAFIKLLASPVISKEEKQEIITNTFEGQVNIYVLNLLRLLAQNDRAGDFAQIVLEYVALLDYENGVVNITAQTSRPINEKLRKKLLEKLSSSLNKNVRLTFEVNPSLLGGILLKGENEQIDATVRTSLNEIKGRIKAASL